MINKVLKRLRQGNASYADAATLQWIRSKSEDPSNVAQAIDATLWDEALEFGRGLSKRADQILPTVPFFMGAGGDSEFLYWLVRYKKPETVVETGVSAGFTSHAILSALDRNGSGTLYSSDFPYFKVRNPENYIGILVEERLRDNWVLHTDGDEHALPRIMLTIDEVDIFHYDSDKSYSGREFAVDLVRTKLAPGGIIIVDDISNDRWFRDYVEREDLPYRIFNGRYGVIGQLA